MAWRALLVWAFLAQHRSSFASEVGPGESAFDTGEPGVPHAPVAGAWLSSVDDDPGAEGVLWFGSSEPAADWAGGAVGLFSFMSFWGPEGLTQSSTSNPNVVRWRCLSDLQDITAPARHPEAPGEIPAVLSLPLFEDATFSAYIDAWMYNPDRSISWLGTLDQASGGHVNITVVDGKTSAGIRNGERYWQIRPDPECGHVVEEFNTADFAGQPEDEDLAEEAGEQSGPPGHPLGVSRFIDILFVFSELARIELGGDPALVADDAGVRGWANNQVHETHRILIRSGITSHQPRCLGAIPDEDGVLVDPGSTWLPDECCNPNCDFVADPNCNPCDTGLTTGPVCPVGNSLEALKSQAALVHNARDSYGADLVQGILSKGYDNSGIASRPDPIVPIPAPPAAGYVSRGYSISNARSGPVFTPIHEFGHSLGVNHQCVGGAPCVIAQSGYAGQASGYTTSVTTPNGTAFAYGDLMASLGHYNGCRIPVFSRAPAYPSGVGGFAEEKFGYRPQRSNKDAPCLDVELTSGYGVNFFEWSVTPLAIRADDIRSVYGLRVGMTETPFESGEVFPSANAAVWFDSEAWQDPATLETATPLEIVAAYRPENQSLLFPPVRVVLNPGDGTLAAPFDATNTFEWPLTPYALSTITPGPNNPYDSTVLDSSPYYLELTLVSAGLSVFGSYLAPSACPGAGQPCAITLTLPNPTETYSGRLWTQHAAGYWQYTEFLVGQAIGRIAACEDHFPAAAPWLWRTEACPATACSFDAGTPTGNPTLTCTTAAPVAGTGVGRIAAVRYPVLPVEYPFDFTVFGDDTAGDHFCCHVSLGGLTSADVVIQGTNNDDVVSFQWVLGAEYGLSSVNPPQFVNTLVQTFGGQDSVLLSDTRAWNSPTKSFTFYGLTGAGGDMVQVPEGANAGLEMSSGVDRIVAVGPPQYLDAFGGAHADTVILAWSGPSAGMTYVSGGTGSDTICSNTTDVDQVATSNGTGPPISGTDQLYLSPVAGGVAPPVTVPPTWLNDSLSGTCGHAMYGSGWAGPCTYAPTFTARPAACAGWMP